MSREPAEIKIAEGIQAVVDGHDHDVAAPAELRAVVEGARAGAGIEGAAVDVEEHRPCAAIAQPRCPNIEEQTVLTCRRAW